MDIGLKSFDGITEDYLRDKVDYTNKNKIFSQSEVSTPVIQDHVLAIRTYRYGSQPLYSKGLVSAIITNDFEARKVGEPTINSQPQYIAGPNSTLKVDESYTYYVSTYDGLGSTIPSVLNILPPTSDAKIRNVSFSFTLPFNARGYTVYRKENSTGKLYKTGPILALDQTLITFTDNGNKGDLVSSLPAVNTIVKSGYKSGFTSKPLRLDFKYVFYGNQ